MSRLALSFCVVAFACHNFGSTAFADEKTDLAAKAHGILKTHCHRCHGENGVAEGGMNYVLDFDRMIARKKIIPGKSDESSTFKRIVKGTMPPEDVTARMTKDEIDTIKKWIDSGAPSLAAKPKRDIITAAQVNDLILADLEKQERRSRRFVRYFTLTHLHNAGLADDEIQTYRNALAKLINSLSWHPKIRNPEPVDPAQTILRIDLRWYMWDATLWNRILNEYPYGLIDDTITTRGILVFTATKVPMLRADWFIATASRQPLYQEILQLPAALNELERQLRVDAERNIQQERVMRAGFNGSGVSRHNRILERHDAVHGYYWRTYDFEEIPQNLADRGILAPDRRNIFAYPLGPTSASEPFQHVGGEAIFSLPNGLQGYFIMNAANQKLDKAPQAIVSDPRRPDKAVELSVSCFGCHVTGILVKADQMHDFLEKNPKILGKSEWEFAKSIYPPKDKTIAQMEEDSKKFRDAVAKTGAKVTKTEPVSLMTLRYEADMDLQLAAAEVGLSPEEFSKRIGESEVLTRSVGALRIAGGVIARPAWIQGFSDVVRELKLGTLFQANQIGSLLADNTGEVDPLEVQTGRANAIVFSSDGRRALIANADRSVKVHEVEGRRDLKRLIGHTASVWSVASTSNGKWAVSGGMDGTLRYWKLPEGDVIQKLDAHSGLVSAVAISPDGKEGISAGFDGAVIHWDLKEGKKLGSVEGKAKYYTAVVFAADGVQAFVAGDRKIWRWDLESGKFETVFNGHTSPVTTLALSSDGKRLISGADDGTIKVWNASNGECEKTITGHVGPVRSVAINDKGDWLLSGGADATVRLWNREKGEQLAIFRKHKEPLTAVGFVDNGKQTISGDRNGDVLLWSIERFRK